MGFPEERARVALSVNDNSMRPTVAALRRGAPRFAHGKKKVPRVPRRPHAAGRSKSTCAHASDGSQNFRRSPLRLTRTRSANAAHRHRRPRRTRPSQPRSTATARRRRRHPRRVVRGGVAALSRVAPARGKPRGNTGAGYVPGMKHERSKADLVHTPVRGGSSVACSLPASVRRVGRKGCASGGHGLCVQDGLRGIATDGRRPRSGRRTVDARPVRIALSSSLALFLSPRAAAGPPPPDDATS